MSSLEQPTDLLRGLVIAQCGPLLLWERWVAGPGGEGPVRGAQASIAVEGEIRRDVTASRLFLFGPVALGDGLRRRTDLRVGYVAIEGDAFLIQTSCSPDLLEEARAFVWRVSQQAKVAPPPRPTTAPTPPQRPTAAPPTSRPQVSLADEVARLAALRDSGVLTEREFAAAKRRLLIGS